MDVATRDAAAAAPPWSLDEARRRRARLVAEAGLIGLVVGLLVVAPWVGSGYLLLLDWVSGPESTVTPGLYGLAGDELDAMPWRLLVLTLRTVVGPAVTAWLLVLAYFPLAAAGAARLVGGGRARTWTAALVITCNPVVVTRIGVGHVPYLIGVALLPWLVAAAMRDQQQHRRFGARTAGLYALGVAVSPHLAWIGGVALLVVACVPRPTLRAFVRLGLTALAAAAVYAYGIVVWLTGVRVLEVTDADLGAYATRAGPLGLVPTVLGLEGFWREGSPDVGATLGLVGIPVLLALLAAVVWGLAVLVARREPLGAVAVVLVVLGLLLALGTQGPFGAVYQAAFDRLPLFEAMREPLKWLALVLVGYTVALASAAEQAAAWARRTAARRGLRGTARRTAPVAGAAVVALLPLVCAPALLLGLGGRVATSEYPDSWSRADTLMGEGDGSVLFLPWHAYQPFAFTDGRTVATPGQAFFRREVLSSDAVELGLVRTDSVSRRSAYVDELLARGGTGGFARLVAPLGVEYVVVSRGADAERYRWLAEEPHLTRVLTEDTLLLYRVDVAGTGRVVGSRETSWPEALRLGSQLGTEALLPDGPTSPPLPSSGSGGLRREGATTWTVAAGVPGWVVVPVEWSAGWRLDGESGTPTLAGTVAVRAGAEGGVVEYRPWTFLRWALAASVAALLVLLVIGLVEHRHEWRGRGHRAGTAGARSS